MNQKNIDIINICLDIVGAIGNRISKADIKGAKVAFEIVAEKQIPKQAEIVDYNYSNLPVVGCPVCKSRKINSTQNYNHCPDCGQAISWEDE